MGWIPKSRRATAPLARRPSLEFLESRKLLTLGSDGLALDVLSVLPAASVYKGPSNGFDSLIGASAARSEYQVDGKGLAVAVIDAGVNYSLPALGGKFGQGGKVSGGYDFAGKDGDPIASGLQHGTAVASLIASNDATYPGVAPGVDIVALRVFNDANKSDFNYVADSLQWVLENHEAYHISVVNISLSDGRNYTRNWYADDGGAGQRITSLVSQLEDLKIPVVTATGNSFVGQQGSGFTGIIPESISVTASNGLDQIVGNAQRLGAEVGGESATDFAAPGEGLMAPAEGTAFSSVTGTSFAAPLVSGSIVLLQQVYQKRFDSLPSVDELESWLKKGAVSIKDATTGLTFNRLDIPNAIRQIPTPAAQVLVPPVTVLAPVPVTVVAPVPVAVVTPPLVEAPAPPASPVSVPDSASVVTAPVVTAPVVTAPVEVVNPVPTPSSPSPVRQAPTGQVWLNGQLLTSNTLDSASAQLGANSTLVGRVLRSFRDWWSSPKAKVRVWGAASNPIEAHAVGIVSLPTAESSGTPVTRPWRAFVSSRENR